MENTKGRFKRSMRFKRSNATLPRSLKMTQDVN